MICCLKLVYLNTILMDIVDSAPKPAIFDNAKCTYYVLHRKQIVYNTFVNSWKSTCHASPQWSFADIIIPLHCVMCMNLHVSHRIRSSHVHL